jgi:serine/threonine protein kinase
MPVIGEGTYGCIHKPSLHCNNSDMNYENKVSKILENKEADKEMSEFKSISNFDTNNEFYLGVPQRCSPAKTQENIEAIEKCKNGKKLVQQLQNYSLLVMEDGGMDLDKYGKILKSREPNEENREKMELFWIEAHRILIGLREFSNHGLVHHDLKPQNIVFNEKINRLNFIDFGLMDTKSNLINSALKNCSKFLGLFFFDMME